MIATQRSRRGKRGRPKKTKQLVPVDGSGPKLVPEVINEATMLRNVAGELPKITLSTITNMSPLLLLLVGWVNNTSFNNVWLFFYYSFVK